MKHNIFFWLVSIAFTSALFYSCSEEETAEEETLTIEVINNNTLGDILVDATGMSLYIFANDVSGVSNCNGDCLDSYTVFFEEDINISNDLDIDDFASIVREDGSSQTTYKGWPLYYFTGDENPGDTNGDAMGEVWFISKPDYSLMLANQAVEGFDGSARYLVDISGSTLYFFERDEENSSNCAGDCLASYPAFAGSSNLVLPSIFNGTQFNEINRTDGEAQSSYSGQPLYYSIEDTQRGEINGRVLDAWNIAELQ